MIVGTTTGSISRPRSRARTLWVRAPIEMRSTPVAAMSWMRSRVMPPLASVSARPLIRRTAVRRSSMEKLSRQNRVDVGGEHCVDLVEAIDFDFEVCGVRDYCAQGEQGVGERGRRVGGKDREVVILGHDGVGKGEAVVMAAAAADSVPSKRRRPGWSFVCRLCGRVYLRSSAHRPQ